MGVCVIACMHHHVRVPAGVSARWVGMEVVDMQRSGGPGRKGTATGLGVCGDGTVQSGNAVAGGGRWAGSRARMHVERGGNALAWVSCTAPVPVLGGLP